MDPSKQRELIAACLDMAAAGVAPTPGEERTVDVARYVDPDRFERERERLFRRGLVLVAHAGALAEPGDFLTREVAGVPVLLARDDAGVRAFVNVCRHRGAIVELREQGSCKRFVCPYHAWTYDCSGALVHVRHREGFPSLGAEAPGLVALPCIERAGFVWVAADPAATIDVDAELPPALIDELRGLEAEDLESFACETRVYAANWKLIADGGLESYHFKVAHRRTIAKYFLDTVSCFEFIGPHTRSVLPRADLAQLGADLAQLGADLAQLGALPPERWELRARANVLYSVFPSASLLVQSDHVVMILTTPLAVDRTRIELHTLAPKGARGGARESYWRANHEVTTAALAEDFELAEQIQRGIASGANAVFRLGRFESAIATLHEHIDARLGE